MGIFGGNFWHLNCSGVQHESNLALKVKPLQPHLFGGQALRHSSLARLNLRPPKVEMELIPFVKYRSPERNR